MIKDLKSAFKNANIVEKIIYINVGLFILSVLFKSFIIEWFALSWNSSDLFLKPWSIISYAFIHLEFFHILSNLLVLYYIGNLFLDFYTKKNFINFYFLGLIFGALIFLVYYQFSDTIHKFPIIGASAAVTTIFVAVATKIPRYSLQLRFIGSVELWVLAAIWVGLSVLQLANPSKGSAIMHISGAVFGFVYAKQLETGNDIGKWFEKLLDFFANLLSKKESSTLKTVHKRKTKTEIDNEKPKQKKIDEILDKISKSGYESLSKEEKDFLFRAGRNK